MTDRTTFRDRVSHHFKLHPGEWVGSYALMAVGGTMAWRTRISDCRLQLGMDIENRCRKSGEITVSEYRYAPPVTLLPAGRLF